MIDYVEADIYVAEWLDGIIKLQNTTFDGPKFDVVVRAPVPVSCAPAPSSRSN